MNNYLITWHANWADEFDIFGINKVPHEGLVIKIDDGVTRAFKLKCFRFLNKEQELLDKGESNIEDES